MFDGCLTDVGLTLCTLCSIIPEFPNFLRSVVQRYGEGFLDQDVRRLHTLLQHIDQEKQHVGALRTALASR